MTTGRKSKVKGKIIEGKFVQTRTYVAGQSRSVLEARAAKEVAKWQAKSKTR
jgi:hypothetical protein